jgi:hypothetical protein
MVRHDDEKTTKGEERMPVHVPTIETLVRIQMDYLEMPGLKLTLRQAPRLWNLPLDLCESALSILVERGFLVQTEDGSFLRRGTTMGDSKRPGAQRVSVLSAASHAR